MKKIMCLFTICILILGVSLISASNSSSNMQTSQAMVEVGSGASESVVSDDYVTSGGITVHYEERDRERARLRTRDIEAESELEIEQYTGTETESESGLISGEEPISHNITKFRAELSNGRNTEIKIMPDVASETATNALRARVCSEDNACELVLKEVGKGEEIRAAYEVRLEKQSKILGFIKAKMSLKAEVNAENGEVISIEKPWWSFLAKEESEE